MHSKYRENIPSYSYVFNTRHSWKDKNIGSENNREVARAFLSEIYRRLVGELPKQKSRYPIRFPQRTEKMQIEGQDYSGKLLAMLELKDKDVYVTWQVNDNSVGEESNKDKNKSNNEIKRGTAILYIYSGTGSNNKLFSIQCHLKSPKDKEYRENGVIHQFRDLRTSHTLTLYGNSIQGMALLENNYDNVEKKVERIEILEFSKGGICFDKNNISKIVVRFCYRPLR